MSQGAAQPAGTAVTAAGGRMLQDPRVRGGKPVKDPLAGLDPKARAIVEQNNAKAAQAALEVREIRRKTRRMELERETGRTGEEVEKLLDEMEQAGKFNEALKGNPVAWEKGGK